MFDYFVFSNEIHAFFFVFFLCVALLIHIINVYYLADFPKTVKRLLKNDILMFRTASSVLHILPIAGLYTFLPKYLESQFRLPTPSANMISGKVKEENSSHNL